MENRKKITPEEMAIFVATSVIQEMKEVFNYDYTKEEQKEYVKQNYPRFLDASERYLKTIDDSPSIIV